MNTNQEVYESFLTNITLLNAEKPVDMYGTELLASLAIQLTVAEQLAKVVSELKTLNDREDILSRRDFHIKTEVH